jgi:tetratricopeptide (TPR) repeat protein
MSVTEQYASAHLDDLAGPRGMIALRRHFGIEAFGVNAWKGESAGDQVIGEHSEATFGHQELYVVIDGHAEFTLDGETLDAPRGTAVFVRNPEVRRGAAAKEDGTVVLAIGAKAGETFVPSGWEASSEAFPYFGSGDYARAKEILEDAHRENPHYTGVLYNLACAEARLGEADAALQHLRAAVEAQPEFGELAKADDDFESIRDDPRFPA